MGLRERLAALVPRWRKAPSDRRPFQELLRSLVIVADEEALEASVSARLAELFRPAAVVLFRLDSEKNLLLPRQGLSANGDGRTPAARFRPAGRLARWLLVNETCLVLGEAPGIADYLEPEERELLARLEARVCAPLLSMGRLTGLVLLCSPDPRWRPGREATELLEILSQQASLAFENASLYGQQKERLRRLYRAERLAAAGQLAAGVAHEVRNPLTSIRSTIQFLARDLPEAGEKRQLVDEVLGEVDRIDRILDQLLRLTRPQELRRLTVDVADVLEQSLRLVAPQAERQGIAIERRIDGAPLLSQGDPDQLKQVFLNLLLNAVQAMQPDGGGRLTVELGRRRTDPAPYAHEWVEARITDSGPGIEPDDLDKVFDPFYTTKRGGTGLGLSVSHGIVHRHDGEIELRGAAERGTVALVRLPLS